MFVQSYNVFLFLLVVFFSTITELNGRAIRPRNNGDFKRDRVEEIGHLRTDSPKYENAEISTHITTTEVIQQKQFLHIPGFPLDDSGEKEKRSHTGWPKNCGPVKKLQKCIRLKVTEKKLFKLCKYTAQQICSSVDKKRKDE